MTTIEVGTIYDSGLGDVLVWRLDEAGDRAHVYHLSSGDLGLVTLRGFKRDLAEGNVHAIAELADVVTCPACRSSNVRLISDGLVDGKPAPFVACDDCAFSEEL